MYPITMQVHVIWHPNGDALCRPLAEHIYLTLNRDPYQPMLPGIGMPVFFRCAGAEIGDADGAPQRIIVPDTKLDLRIALVTEDMLEMRPSAAPQDALPLSGPAGPGHAKRLQGTPQGRYALGRSLTQMRRRQTDATRARIVLGGKVHSFMGFYPGILEEVLQAIDAGHPVYVLGGFGGAARLVAAALEGGLPKALTREWQESHSPAYRETCAFYDAKRASEPRLSLPPIDYGAAVARLGRYGTRGIAAANGLEEEENRYLFHTASVDAALYLVMKSLTAIHAKL
jgi:hypothetical protein